MEEALYHYGILGQKWGVRRYQNADGSLTSEGKERLKTYSQYQEKREKLSKEEDSLIKSSQKLASDFGSSTQVDDPEFFEMVASGYNLDTSSMLSAYADYKTFVFENQKAIRDGEKILKKLQQRG